jgi:hypothetical protein
MRAFRTRTSPSAAAANERWGGVTSRPKPLAVRSEQAADDAADIVMATDAPPLAERPAGPVLAARRLGGLLRTGGRPLDGPELRFFELSFGHDFSRVRIHSDERASGTAALLHARAFTIGNDIFLGRGELAHGEAARRRLLAHELVHIVRQPPALAIQRQEVPGELMSSPDVSSMTEEQLQERHDWILEVLAQFTESSRETALLESQAARLGVELARRRALAEGRTFDDASIQGMRRYFVDNARSERDSCIVALNKAMRRVTGQPKLPTTPESIEATMKRIIASGMSTEAREIRFQTRSGILTRGGARPERIDESVWDTVLAMSGGDPGWSVFTMSLLDGYHSVTLTLDASDPAQPRLYWSDQWQSKGGWKEYTRSTLDAEVTRLVKQWWDGQAIGRKHDPVVRLWRMRAAPVSP